MPARAEILPTASISSPGFSLSKLPDGPSRRRPESPPVSRTADSPERNRAGGDQTFDRYDLTGVGREKSGGARRQPAQAQREWRRRQRQRQATARTAAPFSIEAFARSHGSSSALRKLSIARSASGKAVVSGCHAHGPHSRAAGSLQARQGILEDDAIARGDSQASGRAQIDLRIGLRHPHLVPVDDHLKILPQVPRYPARNPRSPARRW